MQRTIDALLEHRRSSLSIAAGFTVDVLSHPNQDPGCRTNAGIVPEPRRDAYRKAMVIFGYDGCGERRLDPCCLETSLETEFVTRGWEQDQIAFIVLNPELEAWLFGASFHHLERLVNWPQPDSLRDWLIDRGHLTPDLNKPSDPKIAFTTVLRRQRIPPSANLFAELARRVSTRGCQDRAFQKFRATLQRWFPAE